MLCLIGDGGGLGMAAVLVLYTMPVPVLGWRRGIGTPAGAVDTVLVLVYPAGVNVGVVGADRKVERC